MKAVLMPHGKYYKITLTRTEARILAEYSTLYGSKARIEVDLSAAEPECPDDD